jgi:integrase
MLSSRQSMSRNNRVLRLEKGFALPERGTTRSGIGFEPTGDIWSFRDGVVNINLDFSQMNNTSEEFLLALKAALMWHLQRYTSSYAQGIYRVMKGLVDSIFQSTGQSVNRIGFDHLTSYRSANDRINEHNLSQVAAFLKRWSALGYPGVDQSAVKYLSEARFRAREKGVPVRTMDPHTGPLTVIETEAVLSALADAFSQQRIDILEYLLGWLFIAFGMRPVQLAAMKVCDLKLIHGKDGEETYLLSIPRAKQPGMRRHRDENRRRALLPEVGRLMEVHINNVKSELTGRLGELDFAPMFPVRGNARSSEGFEFHQTSGSISLYFKQVLSSLGVLSERTGDEINVTPTRFRRTIGTRAAEEGHGVLVIAELLDHSDTQNAGVYVEATPAIIERIDRAIAVQMAPLAQAFAGKLIRDDSEATRGSDPIESDHRPSY